MSKHTPGPWTVTTTYEHGKKVTITAGHAFFTVATVAVPDDADLLAAAPALLDAAKAALDLLNGLDECEMLLKFGDSLHIVEQLDAAIAAADPDFVC